MKPAAVRSFTVCIRASSRMTNPQFAPAYQTIRRDPSAHGSSLFKNIADKTKLMAEHSTDEKAKVSDKHPGIKVGGRSKGYIDGSVSKKPSSSPRDESTAHLFEGIEEKTKYMAEHATEEHHHIPEKQFENIAQDHRPGIKVAENTKGYIDEVMAKGHTKYGDVLIEKSHEQKAKEEATTTDAEFEFEGIKEALEETTEELDRQVDKMFGTKIE